jgi:predicted alpha/beta superfamily hydrolase
MAMLRTHEVPSRYLGAPRRITVWLPPGSRRRITPGLPVLYLNDGQNLFDPARAFAGATWRVAETTDWLVRRRRIPPLLIVGVDHGVERRGREYLPVEDDRNPGTVRPLGRAYADFITRELLPFVAREYRVARGPSSTAFGGSSYGAVAALNTAIVKPGVFGRLLLESPSLYVGNHYLLRKARRVTRWPARIYIGVGTTETSRADWNEETVSNVRALEHVLRGAGLGPRRLAIAIAEGGTHSEAAWAARFAHALEFLYR